VTVVRIGAVSYLNTRPLIHGFERGLLADRVLLSYDTPAVLADRMAAGDLDVALLPTIELARIPDLEIVPGLAITCNGPSRSVLLVTRKPLDEVRRVALDAESRTSNALARLLFEHVWDAEPEFVAGPTHLEDALETADAVVRIGDKALFEPVPDGTVALDLAEAWTKATGLPFVFAVWACRPGVLDRELYRAFHDSRREGSRAVDEIAAGYVWAGNSDPALAERYLRENILFRLGNAEVRALRRFHDLAAGLGIIGAAPEIRLGMERHTDCHQAAACAGLQRERP
jgi:chorismate dehydratase